MRTLAALLLTIPFLYPFIFLVGTATKTSDEYIQDRVGLPNTFTFDHIRYAWNTVALGEASLNSLVAAAVGVPMCLLISTMAAFWFLRRRGLGAKALFGGIVSVSIFPYVIYMIPLFVLLGNLRLTDNLLILGLVYATVIAPFGLFMLSSYFKEGIPVEVLEAAEVDGASLVRQFRSIVVPLARPALGTLAALAFIWIWGDVLIAVFLIQDPSKFTVVVAASGLVRQFESSVQATSAASVIIVAPMLVVFLLAQRAITRGFTAGVGK